jgi:hypothetical protein
MLFIYIYLYSFPPDTHFITYMLFSTRPFLTLVQPYWLSSHLLIPPRAVAFTIYVSGCLVFSSCRIS